MSHYLTAEERQTKEKELSMTQKDQNYTISLVFHKDARGWYAEVPTHTRGENAMVMGADVVIERMAHGDNTVEIKFRTQESKTLGSPFIWMSRMGHITGWGAMYNVHGLTRIPFPAYLCDVTHDVMGEHSDMIYVYEINHYNK